MSRRGRSVLGLSLAVSLLIGLAPQARATILFVDEPGSTPVNGGCTLADAISSLNADAQVGNCQGLFGVGGDGINLTVDVTLTQDLGGGNGLPQITSGIAINGFGHTVRRDPSFTCGTASDPEFRIFDVANGGSLQLANITVANGCVESSYAGRGAGIRLRSTGGNAFLLVDRSTVRDNRAYGATAGDENNAGGLEVQGVAGSIASASVTNSAFVNNTTDGYGGAISVSIDPTVALSQVNVTSTTFAGNSAGIQGGAIDAEGNAFVNSCTFKGNSAPAGGGNALRAHQTTFVGNIGILNSIFDNGAGPDCVEDDNSAIASQGWNLAADASCSPTHPTDLKNTPSNTGPLTDNGVPGNAHFPLKPNSAAIDSGAFSPDAPGLDQLRQARHDRAERGAVEFIEPDIATTPKSSVNLGRVRINRNGACKTVEIRNAGNDDLDISSISLVNNAKNWFRICSAPATPTGLEQAEKVFVSVRCHPTTGDASLTGTLRIVTNDPQTPQKDITVKCTKAP